MSHPWWRKPAKPTYLKTLSLPFSRRSMEFETSRSMLQCDLKNSETNSKKMSTAHKTSLTELGSAQGNSIACSLGRALNQVGDRWVLMIIHSAFLRNTRFSDIRRATGMARSLLIKRLQRMEACGIIERRLYDEKRQRYDYLLTAQGRDLFDTAMMIVRWERHWHDTPDVITLNIRHIPCEKLFTPQFSCSACGEEVATGEVELHAGPGASDEFTSSKDVRRSSITTPDISGADALLGWAGVILGDRWTPAIICSPLFGLTRFNDIQRFWRIAPNILTDRLMRMVKLEVMNLVPDDEGSAHLHYKLTKKGRDFFPILLTLMSWGDRWLSEPTGPPFYPVHKRCGQRFTPTVRCDQCQGEVALGEVILEPVAQA
jgi:DNA-binding HxlR family transcriptional regulator